MPVIVTNTSNTLSVWRYYIRNWFW